MIAAHVLLSAQALNERFKTAGPFRHVVVDGFFTDGFARDLLDQFPKNDRTGERNEFGAPGIKVVHSDLTTLGSAYREAHAFFGSQTFLLWMSEVTGIPDLSYDPQNFGGGTHENLEGRDLRPHVDFNYHPVTKLHRRVNLIVYLNDGWLREWGGSIALHSDPRSSANEITEYEPLFNRAIIFETNEHSWHGFDLIALPESEKHRTRKSLSIYLYSRERPREEVHSEHTTFFVPRALPERFASGLTLTEEDVEELEQLFGQRDRLISLYQREQGNRESDSEQAARLRMQVAALRKKRPIPIMGYVASLGDVTGMYDDGWSGADLRFAVRAERPVRAVKLHALMPKGAEDDCELRMEVDGKLCLRTAAKGALDATAELNLPAGAHADVRITVSATTNHKRLGLSRDERELGFLLQCLTFEH